ncbi:MAG: hypothetical protein M0Q88_01115 [Bacilli bacterium]|nr:hypothetical protein [Bacilli bacterium]
MKKIKSIVDILYKTYVTDRGFGGILKKESKNQKQIDSKYQSPFCCGRRMSITENNVYVCDKCGREKINLKYDTVKKRLHS